MKIKLIFRLVLIISLTATILAQGQSNSTSIDDQINALSSIDYNARMNAVQAMNISDPKVIDPLTRTLKDDDNADVRAAAAHALGKIKDARSVEPLINALSDDHQNVRTEARLALTDIGTPSVDPLLQSLKNRNTTVQLEAIVALGDIGDDKAVDALTQLFNDNQSNERRKAAIALGKINRTCALGLLIPALKNKDCEVRKDALFALGEIRDVRSCDSMMQVLKDDKDNGVVLAAAESLKKFQKKLVIKEKTSMD